MKRKLNFSILLLGCFFSLISLNAKSQSEAPRKYNEPYLAITEEGDTIMKVDLAEVHIYGSILTEAERNKYAKLIRNVKKSYPYAQAAKKKLGQYNDILSDTKDESKRKEIMKKAEKEIEAEFGDDIRKMSFSQGKVLIKLIDRETGSSSYELVKDLRGNFRAFFYQAFAKVFGFNLKTRYNPKSDAEDAIIERIVRSIELNLI